MEGMGRVGAQEGRSGSPSENEMHGGDERSGCAALLQ